MSAEKELKAKLEQNAKDQKMLQDEQQRLEKELTLATLHVPQHGDLYRHRNDKNIRVLVLWKQEKLLVNIDNGPGNYHLPLGNCIDFAWAPNLAEELHNYGWDFVSGPSLTIPK